MNFSFFKRGVFFVLFAILITDGYSQNNSSTNLKGQNQLLKGVDRYRLLVKFSPEAILDFERGKPLFKANSLAKKQMTANSLADSFTFEQVVTFTPEEKTLLKSGTIPPPAIGKFDYFSFRGLVYVKEAENMDKERVLQLANEFEKYSFVEYAALEPVLPILPPATPDLTSYQHYKYGQYTGQSNVYGIDAEYAWSIGITGQGVKIADIEWGMDYQHEDLISPNFIEYVATTNHDYDDHGTSVAGIMIAKNNGFGVTGMVYGADKFYGVSEITNGRVSGITKGMQVIGAGDVFVYEMQTGGQNGEYVPADYNQAVWDITKTATNAGIIVVAAAGNGNQNLDDTFYASYRARGDNGSIHVGAGTKVGRNKASFSTYGSVVHLQGWGDWTVASTGGGGLYNGGTHAIYTNGFSGTSSATPIVASAVVAVQSFSKTVRGITLTPLQMRDLLIQTGTPQGTGGHIGPLPNIKKAIESLQGNNTAPVVTITAPANNTTYTAPASVTISASATDADGSIAKVEFYQGTTLLNSDAASPYSYTWTNVVAGTYSITAKAYDNKGAVTTSSAISIIVNPGANSNPTVSITSPANNATYTAPANITINANATDADGTISKVEFYNGTTLLTSDGSSPYSYTWSNVAAGTYSLTAKAYDNSTGVTTSSIVTVIVNAGTECTAPAWNASTAYWGDASLGTGNGSVVSYNGRQYRALWWTQNNTPGLDNVWLDLGPCSSNTNPTVSITAPSNNATYIAPAAVNITVTATDADGSISKVEFYNGTTKLGEDASSPYTYAWTNVAAGTYSLTAKAYDNSTGTATSSVITIVVSNPNQNPTVSITAPANNTTFTAPATVNITATATDADGSISKVEFYNGTTKLGEDANSPYTYAWTNVTAGTYSLTAKAYDNSTGTATSSVITIVVSNPNQNPTVSITAPANNATFTAPATVNITATAADTDGNISKVEFYNGTTKLGEDASSPYTYAWANVAAGTYSLTSKAYDNSTGTATSSVITIVVSSPNQNPTVSITAPSNNATYTAPATVNITVTATDADGSISKVEFYNGTTKLGEDASSPYTYAWTNVAAGIYSLTAKAYDNNTGITTSSSVTIVVNSGDTGTEDCSNISPWNSASIYVKDDVVTLQNIKYIAKWWTRGDDPSVKSGEWDVWIKAGECISGTAASAVPSISMIPEHGATIDLTEALAMNVNGISSGEIAEVYYIIYKEQELISLLTKANANFQADWNASEAGEYLLQVIVKDKNGRYIFADAQPVLVGKTTSINDYTTKSLTFYPNPTTEVINLSEGINTAIVFDLSGNIMNRIDMNGSKQINLSEYSAGVYLIQLISNNQSQFIKVTKE